MADLAGLHELGHGADGVLDRDLRVDAVLLAARRSIYTVEVDPRIRTIVQVRGYHNQRASDRPRQIFALWARQERLALADHA